MRKRVICLHCGKEYKVANGTIYMLEGDNNEAIVDTESSAKSLIDEVEQNSWKIVFHKIYKLLCPSARLYRTNKENLPIFLSSFYDQTILVDIGSTSRRLVEGIINVDIATSPNVDIVYNGLHLPFKDGVVDGIIITAVLEHVMDPALTVSEMFRILCRGGRFFASIPFIYPFHASPNDFQRYTIFGLDKLFWQFEKVESGIEGGPFNALAIILRECIASLGTSKTAYRLLWLVAGWFVQPIKLLDIIAVRKPYAHKAAAGFYFIGEKTN